MRILSWIRSRYEQIVDLCRCCSRRYLLILKKTIHQKVYIFVTRKLHHNQRNATSVSRFEITCLRYSPDWHEYRNCHKMAIGCRRLVLFLVQRRSQQCLCMIQIFGSFWVTTSHIPADYSFTCHQNLRNSFLHITTWVNIVHDRRNSVSTIDPYNKDSCCIYSAQVCVLLHDIENKV